MAAKGLGIDDTIANYIASMIPNERGTDWTLDQCMFGDDDHPKIGQFANQMKNYPKLWNLAKRIYGLKTHLGVHAAGIAIIEGEIHKTMSMMKTSKGVKVTCWDLEDSEKAGVLKYDLLTVQALDKTHTTLNLPLEDKQIEWEDSLYSTYNRYLNPNGTLDSSSPELWDLIKKGRIADLFQYDTLVGGRAIKLIQPNSITDLAAGNSIMRLMSEDRLQPLDLFIRNKNNLQAWYNEMGAWGLTEEEIKVLEPHLKITYGIAASQESVMKLSMDPAIANFTVKEANTLRKVIAKKKLKDIESIRELFYSKGKDAGATDNLLDYVWKHQIGMSLGYGFSDLHSVAYSTIALQEANLAYRFPAVYWLCACLSVNASAVNEEDYENLLDEEIIELTDEEDKNTKDKVDYAKIVSSIDAFKNIITIEPPDINRSKFGFTPDSNNNSILYGLKGINRVGEGVVQNMLIKRPYESLKDFLNKMKDGKKTLISKDKVVNLIKTGAFDTIENKPREQIMKDYLTSLTPKKENLNLNNFLMLLRMNLVPEAMNYTKGVYLFTKEARKNRNKEKTIYMLGAEEEETLVRWYRKYVGEPNYNGSFYFIESETWDVFYNKAMDAARLWIKKNMKELIAKIHENEVLENVQKYADGDILQWELDSLNFFKSGHPLTNLEVPNIEFNKLPDIIDNHIEGEFSIKGNTFPRYHIYTIKGVVLVRDKQKHLITFSTPEGVVKVNIYKQSFAKYDKTVENARGEVVQSSFLEKGNYLILRGILRDGVFIPKVYKASGNNPISRIVVDGDRVYTEEKK